MEIHIVPQATTFIRVWIHYRNFSPGENLQLAFWRPGRYEAANYTKFIRKITCEDSQGNDVKITKRNFHTWVLHPENKSDITISYEYYANQLDAGSCYIDEEICYLNFLNFVMFRPARLTEPCRISIDLPPDFETGTSLRSSGTNVWESASFYELADSPLLSSARITHLEYSVADVPFHIWLHNTIPTDSEKVIDDFTRFTAEQIRSMNGFPVDQYHFLVINYPEKIYHGVEHGKSTVICLGPDLFGERYEDFLGISSHELYHAWNVLYLRPAPMVPYNFEEMPVFDTGFVAEGITTYLGDLFLVRSRVRDDSWYLRELEKLFQRHFDNPGRNNTSLANSSIDLWVDGYQPGAPARKGSIYVEGAVLALMLDLKLQLATHGEKSIITLMRELCDRFGGDNTGYIASDIIQLSVEISGDSSLTGFFDNYLYGKNDTCKELGELLGQFGLNLSMQPNPDALLNYHGIRWMATNGNRIRQVAPDAPAASLLRQGDEVVEIDGQPPTAESVAKITGQTELKILRHGRVRIIKLENDGTSYFPILKIRRTKDLQGIQRLNNWLNNPGSD